MKLKAALATRLPARELALITGAYDLVGDVAILHIDKALAHREDLIARTLLDLRPNLRVVARRCGQHVGEYRIPPLKIIAGEQRTTTLHRESGIRLSLDLQQVYFSPRSAAERRRIAALVEPGEKILVPFSGIAPLPLILARHSPAAAITGVEKNPHAHAYARQNLVVNNLAGKITLEQGCVTEVLPQLEPSFHRALLPLPTAPIPFVPLVLRMLGASGWLHVYLFATTGEIGRIKEQLCREVSKNNRTVEQVNSHRCGHIASRVYRFCVDMRIT